jgi:aryl-phospho-beta-D-glucosidase BglC (GH1 family)
MIERDWAERFAREWIEGWNSHDLERIFSHYVEDFEMSSPFIVERMNEPSGVLRGKAAIRPYWSWGLQLQPPIKFELLSVYAGVDKIAIHYRSVGRWLVVEVLTLNAARQVTHGAALYGDPC